MPSKLLINPNQNPKLILGGILVRVGPILGVHRHVDRGGVQIEITEEQEQVDVRPRAGVLLRAGYAGDHLHAEDHHADAPPCEDHHHGGAESAAAHETDARGTVEAVHHHHLLLLARLLQAHLLAQTNCIDITYS